MSSKDETFGTLDRLIARYKGEPPTYGPETPVEERVMMYAQLLGAEDPYQAVLHPDRLDQVLSNTLPDWVLPSGFGKLEIEDLR